MFRFTIRDVLWLTVVVGLGCALYVEHFTLSGRDKRLLAQTKRADRLASELSQVEDANAKTYMRLQDMTRVNAIGDALRTTPPATNQNTAP